MARGILPDAAAAADAADTEDDEDNDDEGGTEEGRSVKGLDALSRIEFELLMVARVGRRTSGERI